MKFSLEKIDLTKVDQLYLLRGYKNKKDDNFCMSLILISDDKNEFTVKLLISKETLGISDGKDLLKYLQSMGMKLSAEVLKSDFDKFYNTRAFKRINI